MLGITRQTDDLQVISDEISTEEYYTSKEKIKPVEGTIFIWVKVTIGMIGKGIRDRRKDTHGSWRI